MLRENGPHIFPLLAKNAYKIQRRELSYFVVKQLGKILSFPLRAKENESLFTLAFMSLLKFC